MKPELPLLLIGALALAAAVALEATHIAVPPELWALAGVGIGGGAGVTIPGATVQSDVADLETYVNRIVDALEAKTPAAPASPAVTVPTALRTVPGAAVPAATPAAGATVTVTP